MHLATRLGLGLLDVLARVLPAAWLLALADAAGTLGWWLSPARRRVIDANLRIAFGDAAPSGREGRRLGRAACRSLARVAAEVALIPRLLARPEAAAKRLAWRGDIEPLGADVAAGRGGIVVTGHLGNWEVGAVATRHRGAPLKAVARPLGNPVLERWLQRRRGGAAHLIRKRGGLREVMRTLRDGGWVALLADQNAGRHGIFVPFFGLEASTFPTPAALAARLGVPIYLGVCLREPGAARFTVHLERLPAPEGADGVRDLTAGINRRLAAWIRRAPEQYNWIHRRWKTRPPGRDRAEPGQPFYARLWPEGHPLTDARRMGPRG